MNATMNGWHDVERVTYAAVYSVRQDTTMVKVFFELDGTKNGTVMFQPEVEGPHFYWEKYLKELFPDHVSDPPRIADMDVEECEYEWDEWPQPKKVKFRVAEVGERQYLNVEKLIMGNDQ